MLFQCVTAFCAGAMPGIIGVVTPISVAENNRPLSIVERSSTNASLHFSFLPKIPPCAAFVLRCLREARRLLPGSRDAGSRPRYLVFLVGGYDVGSSAASGVGRERVAACPGRVG